MTVLLREAIGDRLRHARTTQRRTLREVSRTARVSLGYLSEVERGRKEASSELLAAICDALELPLYELLHLVAGDVQVGDVGTIDEVIAPEPVPVGADAPEARDGSRPEDRVRERVADRVRAEAEGRLQGGRVVAGTVGNDLADLKLQPLLRHPLATSLSRPAKGGLLAAGTAA